MYRLTVRYICIIMLLVFVVSATVLAAPPKIGGVLYLLPNASSAAQFEYSMDQLKQNSDVLKVPSGAAGGTDENPEILVSKPLLGITFYLDPGRRISYGGFSVLINNKDVPALSELANVEKNGILFMPADPFVEGSNIIEVTLQDNRGEQSTTTWEIVVRSRIQKATQLDLMPLTADESRCQNPLYSPDGNYIAYESIFKTDNYIMVMKSDGSDQRRITESSSDFNEDDFMLIEDEDYAFGLDWLSDNRTLVFTSAKVGNYELYLTDVTKSPVQMEQLTFTSAFEGSPNVNHDDTKIAFVSNRDGNPEIFILDVDNPKKSLQQLTTTNGVNLSPVWSPNSRYIAYSSKEDEYSSYEVKKMDMKTRNVEIIGSGSTDNRFPSWSADALKIAYYSGKDIKVYSLITKNSQVVARNVLASQNGRGPIWSPDGTRIVYSSNEEQNPIYIVDLNETPGGEFNPKSYKIIDQSLAKQNQEIDWSPNTDQIAFRSFKSLYWDIWSYNLDIEPRYSSVRFNVPPYSRLSFSDRPLGFAPLIKSDEAYFGTDNQNVGIASYSVTPPVGNPQSRNLMMGAARSSDINYKSIHQSTIDVNAAIRSAIVPGFGQFYRGRHKAAYTHALLTYGLLGFGIFSNTMISDKYDEYSEASNIQDIAEFRLDYKQLEAVRNTSYMMSAGVWTWSIMDALQPNLNQVQLSSEEKKIQKNLPWGERVKSPYGTEPSVGAIGVVAQNENSDVYVKRIHDRDYQQVGRLTSSIDQEITLTVPLPPGQYELMVTAKKLKPFKATVTVEPAVKTTVFVGERKLQEPMYKRLVFGLVPGLHQALSQKDYKKASRIWAITGVGLLGSFIANNNYNDAYDKMDGYRSADQIGLYFDERDRLYRSNIYRSAFIGISGSVYLYSLTDALRGGK